MIIPSFVLAGIVAFVPSWIPVAHAQETITMNPTVWSFGQEVTITGNDLNGQYPRRKRLCTAPDAQQNKRTCFGSYDETNNVWNNDDDRILKWESNEIIFRVPAGEPPQGVVILIRTYDHKKCYGSAGCNLLPEEIETVVGSFRSRPLIDGIADLATGNSAKGLIAGREYEIRGKLFGPEKGSLLIGQNKTAGTGRQYQVWEAMPVPAITRWDYDKIRFTASADIDLGTGLKVHNNVLESDPFVATAAVSSASASIVSSSSSSEPTAPMLFPDVPSTADYLPALIWAKGANIVSGYDDGTFKPDKPVNRAEYLKIVFLAARKQLATAETDTPIFPDVRTGTWFAPFVQAAKATGIVKGYDDGTFRPESIVSIAEGLKMGYLTFGISVPETGGQWYEPFLRHAIGHGVLRDPAAQVGQGMSRKDVVWMVWKLATASSGWEEPSSASATASVASASPVQFNDGSYRVGIDIQPGTYRTRKGASGCYYARLSGFGGNLDDIIENENTDAPAIITILPADKGFKSSRCGTWTPDLSAVTTSRTSFGDGVFIIGTDIEPGTYRNTGGPHCYYSRLSGFSGELKDIVANENTSSSAIVTISAGDQGFKSSGCGTWTTIE